MKQPLFRSIRISVIALAGLVVTLPATAAHALTSSTTTTNNTTDSQRVGVIITKGDQEITRRLTTLSTLSTKISSASHLTADDKTALAGEVSTETTNLTTLKTKLDAETTLAGARADAQSIFNGYRVYALVVPKIALIRTADGLQATEAKLTALAPKLQARISAAQANHKSVGDLQAKLSDMITQTATAQTTSTAVEAKVLPLQPSDYNSDHTLLSGYRNQLQTAHTANQTAIADAKAIVAALKNV